MQRIVEKRGWTGKKGVGWHPRGGWHPSEAIKSDKAMTKKVVSFCEEEIRGDTAELATKKRSTPSVATPGVTHPSDATDAAVKPTDDSLYAQNVRLKRRPLSTICARLDRPVKNECLTTLPLTVFTWRNSIADFSSEMSFIQKTTALRF